MARAVVLGSTRRQAPWSLRALFVAGRGDSVAKRAVIHFTLLIFSVIAVYPVVRVFSISLRSSDRLLSTSLAIIPADATWQNYRVTLFERDFLLWVWNSLIASSAAAIVGVILAATAGYAFSRWRFPGRRPGLILLLATQAIPPAMLLVPLYVVAVRLGLQNTLRGVIFAYCVNSVPFSIWILKGYYDTIPPDLEEAAKIDGTTQMGAFWRIVLPLSAPALVVAFLFNFMYAWNDFLLARIMLQRQQLYTWPLGLQTLQGQFTTQWGAFAAASVLISVPVLILFLYSSKWLVSGLTIGSVKG